MNRARPQATRSQERPSPPFNARRVICFALMAWLYHNSLQLASGDRPRLGFDACCRRRKAKLKRAFIWIARKLGPRHRSGCESPPGYLVRGVHGQKISASRSKRSFNARCLSDPRSKAKNSSSSSSLIRCPLLSPTNYAEEPFSLSPLARILGVETPGYCQRSPRDKALGARDRQL
jgi:hypothetical protein